MSLVGAKTRVNFAEHNSVQHHPKEKKFNKMFASSDGFQSGKLSEDNSSPVSSKTEMKSILKV